MIFKRQIAVIALLLAAAWSVAEPISIDAIYSAPGITRDRQLQEVHQAFRPDVQAYIGFGIHYLPLSNQLPLKSPFGVHDGFAFRHHLELFFAAPALKKRGSTSVPFGLLNATAGTQKTSCSFRLMRGFLLLEVYKLPA